MTEFIHVFTPARGGKPFVVGDDDSIGESGTLVAYIPATPKREAAEDLYEALIELACWARDEVGAEEYFTPGLEEAFKIHERIEAARAEGKER